VVGESPGNLSARNPCLAIVVVGCLPHDVSRSPSVTSSGHFVWPAVAPS
jgi:hypothetical protein